MEHLVNFWEELSQSTLKVVQENMILPSPTTDIMNKIKKVERGKGGGGDKDKKDDKKSKKSKKEAKFMGLLGRGNVFLGQDSFPPERERHHAGGGGGGANDVGANPMLRDTMCELCGGMFPHPVTYHMREAHP